MDLLYEEIAHRRRSTNRRPGLGGRGTLECCDIVTDEESVPAIAVLLPLLCSFSNTSCVCWVASLFFFFMCKTCEYIINYCEFT